MDITLKIGHSEFPLQEVQDVVNCALRAETEQAKLRRDYYEGMCQSFESRHKMSSDEFLTRFDAVNWATTLSISTGMQRNAASICGSDAIAF